MTFFLILRRNNDKYGQIRTLRFGHALYLQSNSIHHRVHRDNIFLNNVQKQQIKWPVFIHEICGKTKNSV